MSSDAYTRFMAQLDSAPTDVRSWETYDLSLLPGLTSDERDGVEQALIARLGSAEDGRVPDALVALGSQAAVVPLREASQRYRGLALARVLRALWDLAKDDDAAKALAQLALSSEPVTRSFATSLAGDVDHPATAQLLVDRLVSDNLGIRSEALSALMRRLALDPYWQDKRKLFGRLVMGLYTPLAAVWRPACTVLATKLEAVARGASPESQGFDLTPLPRSAEALRFQKSVHAHPSIPGPWQHTVDLDAGRLLTGEEVLWAQALLAHALGDGDRRAATAIAALGYVELLSALREQALRTPNLVELSSAIDHLSALASAPRAAP